MKRLEVDHPVTVLAPAFGVSRSGYYRWCAAPSGQRRREDARLKIEIKTLHEQSRGTYGRPRVVAALRRGLSGARRKASYFRPFRAWPNLHRVTQGFALGYHVSPPWGWRQPNLFPGSQVQLGNEGTDGAVAEVYFKARCRGAGAWSL